MPRTLAGTRTLAGARTIAGTRLSDRDFGACLQFDPTGSSLSVPNAASLNVGSGSFSISLWVYLSAYRQQGLLTKGGYGFATGFFLDMQDTAGVIRVQCGNAGSGAGQIQTNAAPFPTLGWHHLVAVVQPGSNTGQFYVDGAAITTGLGNSFTGANLNNTSALTIGSVNASASLGGYLDEVQFYTGALSLAQVQQLYYQGGSIPNGGGITLAGYWKLDEAQGTTTADASGNGNTATLAGTIAPTWSSNIVMRNRAPVSVNIVTDTFTRADSTNNLGSADTGQTWTQVSSTWGISTNQAYNSAGTVGTATIGPTPSDGIFDCDLLWVTGSAPWLICRYVDSANYVGVQISAGGNLVLTKFVGGSGTNLKSVAIAPVNGTTYTVRIVARGSYYEVYLNGVFKFSVTDGSFNTATLAGIKTGVAVAGNRWGNFKVSTGIP